LRNPGGSRRSGGPLGSDRGGMEANDVITTVSFVTEALVP
jgi:hypothetical protein